MRETRETRETRREREGVQSLLTAGLEHFRLELHHLVGGWVSGWVGGWVGGK